ncbi:MAG: phage shock protein PspA [Chitinispirillaceae bacterium]|nr:phage shock protein PspA [Chitinispirillaceae bacterium]
MGVFSRFKDIIGSNINSMLDKAEDPEKMIRLMIQEMEETLVELKSSCAGIMADKKSTEREIATLQSLADKWQERAELAIEKEREDLAKEALVEKKRYLTQIDSLEENCNRFDELIAAARSDIDQLEEKIGSARDKQKVLVKRQLRAHQSLRTQKEIRKAGSSDALRRFEAYEQKIDRMEAEASLVNGIVRKAGSLEDEFERLENQDAIENELATLKKKKQAAKGAD